MTRECSQEYEEVTERCPMEGEWTPKETHETAVCWSQTLLSVTTADCALGC